MKTFKKTILIDLDGVLNTYTGNYDENYIPPIREGAYEFIKELSENYKIILFTTRGSSLASQWLIDNNLQDFVQKATNVKEPCYLMIDDRGLNFRGDYKEITEQIKNFKPWYR